ncbi:Cytochrome P450 [Dillenia turbinata]|uniref:Cytochrome P450 n=1 Tax=Dillenia turbinata TaxID=194707 RepID=A0AAN8W0X3_9MAGN
MNLLLLCTQFALSCALIAIAKHLLHNIRNLPPTPFPSLPILGHFHLLRKPIHRCLSKISDRYGPIVLLNFGYRKVLVISSPELAEECFTKNDVVFANRPRFLAGKIVGSNYTNIVWAPYGDHWRNLRRISALEILSAHRLQTLSAVRSDEVNFLIRRILKASKMNQPVEMESAFFEVMMNAMMRMISGKRFYGEEVEDSEEARRFREISKETLEIALSNDVGEFLPMIRWFDGREKKLWALKIKRDLFYQNLIDQNRKLQVDTSLILSDKTKQNRNLIQVLLSMQEKDPAYYTDQFIIGLMQTLLIAGTDTSTGTMQWALSLLLNHPQVLEKAQAEIDNHVGSGRLINESDLGRLPYLRSIILETLRMYPPSPIIVPHESSDDCTVGGYHIPRGTILFVNIWSIQNSPMIWADPRTFNPERFLGVEGARDGFKFMPFGSGRRACPGEGLAIRMIAFVLGSIIQCFDWERNHEKSVDMSEGLGFLLSKAQPLQAKCKPRPIMSKILAQV